MSYLQAFGDGNKRMGRLLSNEPLLRTGLPPLSFIGIDKPPYILGLIELYEAGSTGLLGEAIAGSYEMTTPDYIQAVTVQRVPHGLARPSAVVTVSVISVPQTSSSLRTRDAISFGVGMELRHLANGRT